MKKIFTTLMSLMLFVLFAKAQTTGGPDAYGYIWRDSNDPNGPAFNWIDISGFPGTVTVTGLADDNLLPPVSLNIPFHYYWYDPTDFRIGSNGYIGFSPGTGISAQANGFPSIPNPTGFQNFIAPFTCDLVYIDNNSVPLPGVSCKYWQSPANDTLIVSWENVPFWDATPPNYQGSNTFQLILSTVDSSITFQYLLQNGVYFNPTNPITTGIENITGNVGLQYLYGVYPLPGMAVKFYYPSNSTFAVTDASVSYTGNDGTRGIFLSKDGAPYVSQVEVKNTGNQLLNPFNVYSRVVNAANAIQVRDTVQTGILNPGQSQLISFPDQWTPTIAGTYRHIGVTLLAGDLTIANNQKDLEVQVVDTTQSSILLSYDNGTASAAVGLNWAGGNGGGAMYFIPPFYPCVLTAAQVFIAADANALGYSVQAYDDDGPNGAALTQMDSIFVPVSLVGAWGFVNFTTPITLTSGGIYIAWMMGGDGVTLGVDDTPPFSFRSYEILGLASNPTNWAEFRENDNQEPMINLFISSVVGIHEVNASDQNTFGEFYPNPALSKTKISFDLNESSNITVSIYDVKGQLLHTRSLGKVAAGAGSFEVDMKGYDAGVYFCTIVAGNNEYQRKINLIK